MHFRMSVCQINENREISDELQHNFHFLPHFNFKNTGPNFTKFSHNIEASFTLVNVLIEIAISNSVSE